METADVAHIVGEEGEYVEFATFEGENEGVILEEANLGAVQADTNVFLVL